MGKTCLSMKGCQYINGIRLNVCYICAQQNLNHFIIIFSVPFTSIQRSPAQVYQLNVNIRQRREYKTNTQYNDFTSQKLITVVTVTYMNVFPTQ